MPIIIKSPVKLADEINEANTAIALLKAMLGRTRSILRGTPGNSLKWSTRGEVTKSFRYMLNMYRNWLLVREQFVKTMTKIRHLHTEISRCPDEHRLVRSIVRRRYGGHHTHQEETAVLSSEFEARLIGHDDYELAFRVIAEWNELCQQANLDYKQTSELLVLPAYLELKKLMPRNGRAAYSVLIACQEGKMDRNLPQQHRLFGWSVRDPYGIPRAIKSLMRAIGSRQAETSGPAPSFKTGAEILRTERIRANTPLADPNPCQESRNIRQRYLTEKYCTLITQHTLCGPWTTCSPSMLKFIRNVDEQQRPSDRQIKINHRVAFKIMGLMENDRLIREEDDPRPARLSNQVLTLLTGSFVRHHGDDYYAPCIYSEDSSRDGVNVMRVGYVLLRKDWPDMIHVKAVDFHAHDFNVTTRLDNASFGYFRNIREAALKKLTQNQRIAIVLRQLRSMFLEITVEDSYAVSNCVPGTQAFIKQLTINEHQSISGPALARFWRKAKYPQIDRLTNVVYRMLQRHAERIQAANAACVALFEYDFMAAPPLPPSDFPLETLPANQDDSSSRPEPDHVNQEITDEPGPEQASEQPVTIYNSTHPENHSQLPSPA